MCMFIFYLWSRAGFTSPCQMLKEQGLFTQLESYYCCDACHHTWRGVWQRWSIGATLAIIPGGCREPSALLLLRQVAIMAVSAACSRKSRQAALGA